MNKCRGRSPYLCSGDMKFFRTKNTIKATLTIAICSTCAKHNGPIIEADFIEIFEEEYEAMVAITE